jgi:hypothetical protein
MSWLATTFNPDMGPFLPDFLSSVSLKLDILASSSPSGYHITVLDRLAGDIPSHFAEP